MKRKKIIFYSLLVASVFICSPIEKLNKAIKAVPTPSWKDAPQSKREIIELRHALQKSSEFICNYTFKDVGCSKEFNYVGRGREGIVYIARKINSNQLMAIKVQCERDPVHRYNGKEEVEAVHLFQQVTGYPFEAHNHPASKNGVSFNTKTFIAGETLEKMMKSNRLFDGSVDYDYICTKLHELFTSLINHGLFFADTAPENFVFDGSKFYMVDLRPLKHFAIGDWKSDPSMYIPFSRKKYHEKILGPREEIAWTQDRWYHECCSVEKREAFKNFLKKIFDDCKRT